MSWPSIATEKPTPCGLSTPTTGEGCSPTKHNNINGGMGELRWCCCIYEAEPKEREVPRPAWAIDQFSTVPTSFMTIVHVVVGLKHCWRRRTQSPARRRNWGQTIEYTKICCHRQQLMQISETNPVHYEIYQKDSIKTGPWGWVEERSNEMCISDEESFTANQDGRGPGAPNPKGHQRPISTSQLTQFNWRRRYWRSGLGRSRRSQDLQTLE